MLYCPCTITVRKFTCLHTTEIKHETLYIIVLVSYVLHILSSSNEEYINSWMWNYNIVVIFLIINNYANYDMYTYIFLLLMLGGISNSNILSCNAYLLYIVKTSETDYIYVQTELFKNFQFSLCISYKIKY